VQAAHHLVTANHYDKYRQAEIVIRQQLSGWYRNKQVKSLPVNPGGQWQVNPFN